MPRDVVAGLAHVEQRELGAVGGQQQRMQRRGVEGGAVVRAHRQFGWMPACFTTAVHLTVSDWMKRANSSGELPTVKAPMSS